MMKRERIIANFTLLEVVAALLILMLGVSSLFWMLSAAGQRLEKATLARHRQHLMVQAAEYFLLYPLNAEMDRKFFPNSNYALHCAVDSPDGLPDGVPERIGTLRLVKLAINMTDYAGNRVDSMTIDRIVEESQP